jgi:hypothetical protein
MVINAPFLFWLTKLPATNIVDILFDIYKQSKSPKIYNFTKIILLLGDEVILKFKTLFEAKYNGIGQKPDYYYTFMEQIKPSNNHVILKALKATNNKILIHSYSYSVLIKDNNIPLKLLSEECLSIFKGNVKQRTITRDLDLLTYGDYFTNNNAIIDEIRNRDLNVLNL